MNLDNWQNSHYGITTNYPDFKPKGYILDPILAALPDIFKSLDRQVDYIVDFGAGSGETLALLMSKLECPGLGLEIRLSDILRMQKLRSEISHEFDIYFPLSIKRCNMLPSNSKPQWSSVMTEFSLLQPTIGIEQVVSSNDQIFQQSTLLYMYGYKDYFPPMMRFFSDNMVKGQQLLMPGLLPGHDDLTSFQILKIQDHKNSTVGSVLVKNYFHS